MPIAQRAVNTSRDRAKLAKQIQCNPGIAHSNAWVTNRWPVLGSGLALGIAAYSFLHQIFRQEEVATDEIQEKDNIATSTQWESYSPHRETITGILESAQLTTQGRLCVLGAGNSNDLDLRRLLRSFSHIDLLDIDGKALERGLANQFPASDELANRITLHSGLDALGVPSGAEANAVLESLRTGRVPARFRKVVPSGCDVVAGTCIVSQLALTLSDRLTHSGQNAPQVRQQTSWEQAVPALVKQYVETLVALTRPRDTSVVVHISDIFLSSSIAADLHQGRARRPVHEDEVREHVHKGNIFPGTNLVHYIEPGLHRFLTSGQQVLKDDQPYYWSWCLNNLQKVKCMVAYAVHWRYTQVPERRICPDDGLSYTWAEFQDRRAKDYPHPALRMEQFTNVCQPDIPPPRIEL
mmetsp:Transcript_16762/g.31108  ORF Transcript_16762/g.31108 Transcript_16762/m.31108 type:complete len:410 (+) Transcript_16762:89-1318(+)